MVIAEVAGGNNPAPRYRQTITRLGGGMTRQEGLTPKAMERTLLALIAYAEFIRGFAPASVRESGTAALRCAVNAADFIDKVREETGFSVEIIAGTEEAALTTAGVLSVLNPLPPRSLLFDIGGGSTEIILLEGRQLGDFIDRDGAFLYSPNPVLSL